MAFENKAGDQCKWRKFRECFTKLQSTGNEAVVRLLLENGTNVNAEGGAYGNALQAATRYGNEAMLLEKGANVNVEGGKYGTALQAALCDGNETVVRLLLENGANVNAEGGEYGNALQAAVIHSLVSTENFPLRSIGCSQLVERTKDTNIWTMIDDQLESILNNNM